VRRPPNCHRPTSRCTSALSRALARCDPDSGQGGADVVAVRKRGRARSGRLPLPSRHGTAARTPSRSFVRACTCSGGRNVRKSTSSHWHGPYTKGVLISATRIGLTVSISGPFLENSRTIPGPLLDRSWTAPGPLLDIFQNGRQAYFFSETARTTSGDEREAVCGIAGLFVGGTAVDYCPRRLTGHRTNPADEADTDPQAAAEPGAFAYRSPFTRWDSRASVRTAPRRERAAADGKLFFSPELVPVARHPWSRPASGYFPGSPCAAPLPLS
jgi:hypothetical protein